MIRKILLLATTLAASTALGQNTPTPPPAMGGRMGPQQDRAAMREQMMKSMQADLDTMRANLKKMKDQLGKVSDPATKEQMQLNINMWQSVIDNMNRHLTMMKQGMGPGGGMMRGQPGPPRQQPSPQ